MIRNITENVKLSLRFLTSLVVLFGGMSCGPGTPQLPTAVSLSKDASLACTSVLQEVVASEAKGMKVMVNPELGGMAVKEDDFGESIVNELQHDYGVERDFSQKIYDIGKQKSSLEASEFELPPEVGVSSSDDYDLRISDHKNKILNIALSVPVLDSSAKTSLVLARMRSDRRDGRLLLYVLSKETGQWKVKGNVPVMFE